MRKRHQNSPLPPCIPPHPSSYSSILYPFRRTPLPERTPPPHSFFFPIPSFQVPITFFFFHFSIGSPLRVFIISSFSPIYFHPSSIPVLFSHCSYIYTSLSLPLSFPSILMKVFLPNGKTCEDTQKPA